MQGTMMWQRGSPTWYGIRETGDIFLLKEIFTPDQIH